MTQPRNPWRPFWIFAVLALCVYALAQKGLKPGMDLAGGFVLTYDVKVPEGQDSAAAVEQIISVLSKRVDPTGTRNLVWRRQGANRLEIQSALASKDIRKLREDYIKASDALKTGNVSRFQLESSLRNPAQRQADFAALAAGSEARTALLKNLATTFDAYEAARKPYEDAVKEAAKAQENFDKLTSEAPAEQKAQMEAFVKERTAALTAATKAYFEARNKFEPAINAVLSTNLDANEVDRVFNLPNVEQKQADGKMVNLREEAVKLLINEHSDRAKDIRAAADAHAAYAAKRGPLDDPEDLIAMLRGSGVLEFRIAPEPTEQLNMYRDQLREKGPNAGGDRPYLWFPVDDVSTFAEKESDRRALEENPAMYWAGQRMVGEKYGDKHYVLLSNQKEERLSAAEEGWRLDAAFADRDQEGFPAIAFRLNTVGGQLLGEMTEKNKGRLMTIVLDGRAVNAANIRSRIDTAGQISKGGGYSAKELDYMIRTLDAGSLKATLSERPSSIKFFQAEAGADNLKRGQEAFIIAFIMVAVFQIGYYFGWGIVAFAAVVFNIVIILGIMSLLESTFTMAGIAGIVLTIGMAVDANVLIFERIREELTRGADVKTAVRLGFDKAMSTILDSNVTTLITCVILGYFATTDVRGFAVSLGIGLVANVFTAVYCSRWVIDSWIAIKNPKTGPMLPLSYPAVQKALTPNIDWMAKRKIFFGISAAVCIIGMGIFFARGVNMLDIEFRSGTQVGIKLADQKNISLDEARTRLKKVAEARKMPELATPIASLVPVGDLTLKNEAHEFNISVLNEDSLAVSDAIKEAFKDVLNVERKIRFKGDGLDKPAAGPEGEETVASQRLPDFMYIIRGDDLGESIGRPSGVKVHDFIGGVAVVLDELSPAVTIKDLSERIKRQRSGPLGEQLGAREVQVIGLDQAAAGEAVAGEPVYSSAVVVVTDRLTNYAENPTSFPSDINGLAGTEWKLIREALSRDSSLDSVSNFSSQVSATMQRQASVALILSMIAIAIYIWIRFGSLRFGTGAIVALIHDVAVALGFVALSGVLFDTPIGPLLGLSDFKINLTMVAAILTIVGYSINDKIVVFDRIRELRGRLTTVNESLINDAINQTISRTILTGGTTLVALLILYFLGGEAVRGFAYALFIGILTGTYSSIAIASPLLLGKTIAPATTGVALVKGTDGTAV